MFEFTQETTKTGHVASFISDAGVSYLWATQFDFDVNIDTAMYTFTEVDWYYTQADLFFIDEDDDYLIGSQQADRIVSPDGECADWAEDAFHF